MASEKSLVAILMKQKIRGMAPAPTEEQIFRQMEKNNVTPERQVKLHTLSILKKAGAPEEAQQHRLADELHAKLKERLLSKPAAEKWKQGGLLERGSALRWQTAMGRMISGTCTARPHLPEQRAANMLWQKGLAGHLLFGYLAK